MDLPRIAADLQGLGGLGTFVYGSAARGRATPRSDVDVAVVTGESDHETNRKRWLSLLGTRPDRYDIRVFELLPLTVQHAIWNEGVLIEGDPVQVSSYVYGFRKRWRDQSHRIIANRFGSAAERLKALRETGTASKA